MEAYLDNAATTRPFKEVWDIMKKTMEEDYGNPSSLHKKGMEAENYLRNTRTVIAESLKVKEKEIVITSGGTESNNMALIGGAFANQRSGKHIITTRIEHASVYNPLLFLEKQGFRITFLPVDNNGHVDLEELKNALCEETILVSIMHVNNEMGAVEDLQTIGEIIRAYNPEILFHVDAIQSFGKFKIYPKQLGVHMLSVSGHKIHGPKGVGFLYIQDKTKVLPLIHGGGQQKGMRSGTENVPGIAGLGKAVELIYENHADKIANMYCLKEYFVEEISRIEGVKVNGLAGIDVRDTAPHVVSVSFKGIRSEVLLHALEEKGVYVSSGSACSSNHPSISGTLRAIGVDNDLLDSTLRFSFSVNTTKEELAYAMEQVKELLPMLRRFTRR
ncbi:MAG: cysteine desulfurase [Lachnospiraceae bacterium]|nr:cysteine desulfurase [Lachnospiraceae bacterium]